MLLSASSALLITINALLAVRVTGQLVVADYGSDSQSALSLDGMFDEAEGLLSQHGLLDDAIASVRHTLTGPPPKPHRRRPASEWDFTVRGVDVEALMTEGASPDEPPRRKIGGQLGNYALRAKSVDPSGLKIDTVKQYSGYLDDDEEDKHFFYWFFESRNDPANDPVILWLNGGPGCSSLLGLFMELGPSMINETAQPVHNPFSWNTNASVIFLDQPINVGYSYSSKSVATTTAAARDVYALLTLFFHQFPQYATQDFHIAGESYAGHYIPVFATEILSHPDRNINLRSILIGNGLTDPATQYAYYRPMACGEGGYPAVLSPSECQSMDNALPRCQSLINNCYQSQSVWQCVPATVYCNNAMIGPYQRTGQNVYDVRSKCEGNNLCYPLIDSVSEYLNNEDVMVAVGAEVDSYDSCNFDINRNFVFAGDWMLPFHLLVPALLERIPILIYAGDADYICNWLGNLAWANALEWPGQPAFADAPLEPLVLAATTAADSYGAVKSSGNLTFVQLYAAGHMAPMDQPEPSLLMLNSWLHGEWTV